MAMLGDTAFLPMSRTYYESQGGVFGLAAYDGASVSSSYVYGIDQDHIAYCGPYLCTNVTDNNSISYVANPDYPSGPGRLRAAQRRDGVRRKK